MGLSNWPEDGHMGQAGEKDGNQASLETSFTKVTSKSRGVDKKGKEGLEKDRAESGRSPDSQDQSHLKPENAGMAASMSVPNLTSSRLLRPHPHLSTSPAISSLGTQERMLGM